MFIKSSLPATTIASNRVAIYYILKQHGGPGKSKCAEISQKELIQHVYMEQNGIAVLATRLHNHADKIHNYVVMPDLQ